MLQVKGTRTRSSEQVARMSCIIETLRSETINRGALERDYPIIEETPRLMEKYGDDEKQVYNLERLATDDVGHSAVGSQRDHVALNEGVGSGACGPDHVEQSSSGRVSDHAQKVPLSLRYDLTTQFACYVGREKPQKSFQVGKVFRRDTPNQSQLRWREFYQFDYDLKGFDDETHAILECLDTLYTCLEKLGLGRDQCTVSINDRRAINAALARAEIPAEYWKTTCSTLDKLDKLGSWDAVVGELRDVKGVPNAERIQKCVEEIDLTTDEYISPSVFEVFPDLRFDGTLVRGLDYYTGVVFEVKLGDKNKNGSSCSISGGGQYRDSIGFSIGLDRILDHPNVVATFSDRLEKKKPLYLITFGGKEVQMEAIKKARGLRKERGVPVKIYPIPKPAKLKNAIEKANKDSGEFLVFGPDDLNK